MKKRWWEVRTGASMDERRGDGVFLGKFYGYVDDIALRLADKQCGFWCDGALYFSPCAAPRLPDKEEVRAKVNVVIRGVDWKNGPDLLRKMTDEFADRPVRVLDCNLYGTVTIERIEEAK